MYKKTFYTYSGGPFCNQFCAGNPKSSNQGSTSLCKSLLNICMQQYSLDDVNHGAL